MGLKEPQVVEALGIAEYHAPNAPMMVDIDHPAMVKHAMGWGAMNGVVSAELAADGFSGTPSLLGDERYTNWVSDIGETYVMEDGLTRKRKGFACCAWTHGAAEAARQLVENHAIPLSEIAEIRVETFHEGLRLGTNLPTTTEEAQFNMAWPVAAMVLDGEIGPCQTLEDRLADPELRHLAAKVTVVESDELNRLAELFERGDHRGRWASRVSIHRRDGNAVTSELADGGFHFPAPVWTEADIEDKFRWLGAMVLDEQRLDRILDTIWTLEGLSDVRELTALMED
jgi:2-methylcitrate dehydratase PrpD